MSSSTTASVRLLPDENPIAAAESLIARGRAEDAVRLLRDRVEGGRGGLLLRLTLQQALLAAGANAEALAQARETALTNPDAAPAALALGEALLANAHLPTAIGEFQRALRLDPHLDEARAKLGAAWLEAGEPEKALDAWRPIAHSTVPALAAGIAEAERMLAAPRSDPRYVRHLFDQFSQDYDARMLGQLDYAAPSILRRLGELIGVDARAPLTILDLGCGTGLAGQALRDWASRLEGVDLSPAMIEKARARGIYDSLRVADLCEWLAVGDGAYDLVVAADTLVYLGDLAGAFAGAARRLAVDGYFLFTVEKKEGEGFELGPKRRWRHSDTYLRNEARRAGLSLAAIMECSPRREANVPVEGFAVALRRDA